MEEGDIAENPMNDKPDDEVLARIDQLLSQMVATLQEIRAALPILTNIPPETRASGVLRQALWRQVRAAGQQYMSMRWHRRDGNVYGIVSQSKEVADNADSAPGDLRPPDQR